MGKNEIQPLFLYLLENGGFDNVPESWVELADKFNIAQDNDDSPEGRERKGCAARKRWSRSPFSKMDLTKITLDKSGKAVSIKFSKTPLPDDIRKYFEDDEVVAGTTNAHGGGWLRFKKEKPFIDELTPEEKEKFEARKTDYLQSKEAKSIEVKKPKQGSFENWIILGCVHVPGHNKYLLDGVLRYISENEIHGIILAGDFLDLKSLSSHDKGKEIDTNLWDEYMEGFKIVRMIEQALADDAKKIYLYGNHDDRYLRTLEKVENSRFGQALISPQQAMEMEGWQVLNNWKEDYVLLGENLEVIHGYYTNKNAPKSHLDASAQVGRSVVFFHTHREGFFSNGSFAAWNCGSLANFDDDIFAYVPRQVRQGWRNGFCTVTIDSEGRHYVNQVRCSEKFFFANGIKY